MSQRKGTWVGDTVDILLAVLALIGLAAAFTPKVSMTATWACIILAWVIGTAMVCRRVDWTRGRRRAATRIIGISGLLAISLFAYGRWLESGKQPPLEEVRVVEVRQIPSRYQDAPVGLEILLQTTVPLQPVYLNIEFAEPIQHVEIFPTEDFTGTYSYGAGTVPGAPNIAAVSLSAPAFVPEHAMAVRVYSKSNNRFRRLIGYEAGHPR